VGRRQGDRTRARRGRGVEVTTPVFFTGHAAGGSKMCIGRPAGLVTVLWAADL
jgi:hypothetical protein